MSTAGPAIRALVMGPGVDNVVTAIVELTPGERLDLEGGTTPVDEVIPAGHKVALRPIAAGAEVVKYGEAIGRAVADIPAGRHVHVHNVVSVRLPGEAEGADGGG